MALNLRCRGPNGQVNLSGISPDLPIADFQRLLHDKTGVAPERQEILSGFPPKQLQLPEDRSSKTVSSLPLMTGDTLTLREVAITSSGPTNIPGADADLAQALAMSLASALQQQQQPSTRAAPAVSRPSQAQPAPKGSAGPAPTSIALPDGSCVVRRIIDSDNSCLFNAVGYVMEHTRAKAKELRSVIAQVVSSDPIEFNDGFLGMENEDYCKWIMKPDKWGGGIELAILSRYYGREIAAYDIQTQRCDLYGQDAGYTERVMLIYDGLHYDAMAMSAFEGAPEELDVTIFEPSAPSSASIADGAAKLVEATHAARQFTDTANFTLRCGVCQIGLKGEKEAVEHAKATGHSNFAEY